MSQVHSGLDILLSNPKAFIKEKKIGLIVNQTSVASNGEHSIVNFQKLSDFELVKLFAPEHGLYGEEQDMAEVAELKEHITG